MMAQRTFYHMFLDLLRDIFDAEQQIVQYFPKLIQAVTNVELRNALNEDLDEAKSQLERLKSIFKSLNENPTGKTCLAMQGLLAEFDKLIGQEETAAVKDADLIICCQKIKHYEIASYGSARSIARHLKEANVNDRVDFDDIADFLQQSLDEEISADEELTDIAEGGFFTRGINDEAEEQEAQLKRDQQKNK
jgi:ferritin-like metal-binding protein YciE